MGFTSTSLKRDTAKMFAKEYNSNTLLQIRLPANNGASAYMGSMQVYEEQEMLLKPNLKYIYLGTEEKDGYNIITLEVIVNDD